MRAARSQSQRGRGGGGKTGGRRPTCRQGSWPDEGKAAKEECGFCQGRAEKMEAEGEALCATPGEASQRGRQT
ncbi:hypothetical protein HZS38_03590 [Xenorhabdus nematophila]|uniref:hypothetical protein n=1 Tax=Xenorhabdus nematophila TaxID=628 RepID=UPI000A410C3B|nr:hypothetical protein [Xenorhabdus nematophila]MBA0018310.1 hypothetical protein [Xenorhabdus nematophila]MCB4427167.1 hypothetical protein [Xenorhabdus nematophila]QNJ37385.1 hypothetical protein H8F46_03940 [Xenorhabdus nematophila]QNJ37391.1 hypothetical protein H8F46_03985 [Xenorhabdus nematophila]